MADFTWARQSNSPLAMKMTRIQMPDPTRKYFTDAAQAIATVLQVVVGRRV